MLTPARYHFGLIAHCLGVAGTYFAAARFGVAFVVQPESISVFWPPAGLLLAYLLLTDRCYWPFALAAAFGATVVANFGIGKGVGPSIGFGIVNALEPAVGAWAISRLRRRAFGLESTQDLLLLFGVPAVVCAVMALAGAAVAAIATDVPFWAVWKVWWLADTLGVVLFAPLVVCWANRPSISSARHTLRELVEAVATLAALATVSWGIFATPTGEKPLLLTLPYPVFPLLLWVALRLGARGTAVAVVVVSLIAVWGSSRALGPVSAPHLEAADRVLLIQGFCGVVSLSTFLLVVAITERQSAIRELRTQKQILESVLDSMGEAVLVTDAAGAVVLLNRTFRNIHARPAPVDHSAWPRAFGVYLPDGKTLCPSDQLPIFRAARGEACDNVELMIVDEAHPDGLPVSVTGRPILGPNGGAGAVIAIRDVSAVRHTENKLRDSEQRYRNLVNGVRDYAIFMLDTTGRIASWNDGAERIKGYVEDEILGQHFSCFYPQEDVAAGKTDRELRIASETGRYEEEGWRVRKDGARFWANVVISAVYDSAGRLQGFAKATRDLSAKRAADDALRQSELRFRAIFDQTLQFIGLMAADGTLLEANRTALAATGILEEQVLGQKFWDTPWWMHDAAQQERLRNAVRRAAAGETVRFEAHHPAADGTTIWVDFSLKPYVADGNVLFLIPEGRDITQRRRTEQQLAALTHRLRLLLESSGDGIYGIDLDGRCTFINPAAAEMLGWDADELLGRNMHDTIHHRRADKSEYPLAECPIFCSFKHGQGCAVADESFWRRDHSAFPVEYSSYPLRDEGVVVGAVVMFRDISERQRTERALRRSVREKEVLLREIHHRVKNNLAVIASLFRIQARAVDDKKIKQVLFEAQTRVLSMSLVHENLYNSADLGAVAFDQYAKTLATQIVQTYQFPTTPVELACDVHDVRLTVEQSIPCGLILNEVLSNCLKHAFRDRNRGRVALSISAAAGVCVIRVSDDGVGAPGDMDSRLGKSLGVRLVRILARQLAGTVEYLSPEVGTEVRLTFPIAASADHDQSGVSKITGEIHGNNRPSFIPGVSC
ncbi:PAS domain S-box protein [Limnoglobus roseus]|uniref:histidine kinase n=1 Tax=Limnoglobus roseus TaxID=2598579 RepID=A0A5C1ATC3_9BACT|nr:PAS domain S-box protein [Limnoglobus roseus]QEL20454.1 putative histidine kinase [Limnoglobus roseus]